MVTQTNEQAFDVTRRLGDNKDDYPIHLYARRGLDLPADIRGHRNVRVIEDFTHIPQQPGITVGNAAKWSWINTGEAMFELQIVDEAFQLPDYRYQLIANLAPQHVLIGDPGQIDPFVDCEIERWRCNPAGPQVAAPEALIKRHPGVLQLALPVSRRLNVDTVRLVQPAFYPDMSFEAMSADRDLTFEVAGIMPFDAALDAVTAGAKVVMVELPPQLTGERDEEIADELVASIRRLLMRKPWVRDDGKIARVTPGMIGVVAAHVSQVNAVRERLGRDLDGIFIETANRFQGIERPIMFVHHPLSGRADASAFHLDAGRLCVMLSRHRVACWIFGRQGIARQLMGYAPIGDRALGIDDDPEYRGWYAHLTVMSRLAKMGRIYPAVHGMAPAAPNCAAR